MKSLATALAAVALFCLVSVPARAQNPAVDLAAEKAALLAAAKAFNASTGDLEKRMSFFAEDAVWLGPGQGALVGKAAIRARAAELKALPGFTVESETRSAELAASADLGYTFGAGTKSTAPPHPRALGARPIKAITVEPRKRESARREDVPDPAVGGGSVLVEAGAAGVCRTDT